MARRRAESAGARRRVPASGTRRTVARKAKASGLTLDDVPIGIAATRDQKRLIVRLPYDLWTVELSGDELRFVQNIELKAALPSVSEGEDGQLWIGGDHFHRGRAFDKRVEKVGAKLGGYVDDVAFLRPGLLCGVGSRGEVLIDLDKETVVHKRAAKSRPRSGRPPQVTASADERAIFADGSSCAWIIDPAHPGGYTQLRFETQSDHEPAEEGVVVVKVDRKGRCLLGARDGAVAWTHPTLRRAGERWVELPASERDCLALDADDHWLYVLRPRGRLQRFLIAPLPEPEPEPESRSRGRRGAAAPTAPSVPEAQETRLSRPATSLACVAREAGARLVLGGPQSEGMLGRLWLEDPEQLEWSPVETAPRPTRAAPDPEDRSAPNFEQIRSKIEDGASQLAAIAVDEVIGGRVPYWVAHNQGQWTDRPVTRIAHDEVLPGDLLLLPAMIRSKEGTARPALLAWPGQPEEREGDPPSTTWLCWGDEPRGWMKLDTPQIREQRWSRAELFPLQVALRGIPEVAGRRARLPKRWADREQFDAMARECKKLLKVLW